MSKDVLALCVTFDIDLDVYCGTPIPQFDECVFALRELRPFLRQNNKSFKATWFLRLDGQIERLFGRGDHFLVEYQRVLAGLVDDGEEIGWHPHCFRIIDGGWVQNVDPVGVIQELETYGPLARSYGLTTARMGWGFQTNETIRVLAGLGFSVDSSAIPRPLYRWEATTKNWEGSPHTPYFPSAADYRLPGEPHLSILEIPISTIHIRAPYDETDVVRYINLAYHPDLLAGPLETWIESNSLLVTVTHPQELVPGGRQHGLIAHDILALQQNIEWIKCVAERMGKKVQYMTLSEYQAEYFGTREG